MKLCELFERCAFDAIVPHLLRIDPEHELQLPYYREAYDILRHTPPRETDETIPVEWCDDDVAFGGERYLHIGNCEGDYWDCNLGKRLAVAGDVALPDEELAAHCLWSLTFYGYTPDDRDYFDREPRNRYELLADRLENKRIENYARQKHVRALSMEEWAEVHRREKRRNRPKRMRDHRQKRRIDELKRMGCAEHTITQILDRTDAFSREQLSYLFDTEWGSETVYRSRAYDKRQRLPYLLETVTRYAVDKNGPYSLVLAILSVDKTHPLEEEEAAVFRQIIASLPDGADICRTVGTRDGLGEEAELMLIKSR